MPWSVAVHVNDVNAGAIGAPAVDGTYQQSSGTGVISGTAFDLAGDVQIITLHITHPDYVSEDLTALAPAGDQPWRWNNPVCSLTNSGNTVDIVVVLSRIRRAPVVFVPEDALPKYAGAPSGILLGDKGGGNLRYRNLFDDPFRFRALDHPLLDRNDGTPWQRFRYKEGAVNPSQEGHFIILEYGDTNSSSTDRARFLVSVYFPRRSGPGSLTAIDFILFYSPSTLQSKYTRASYPYGITKDQITKGQKTTIEVHQPYQEIGQSYFFNDHWLAYQLLAAPRTCALVMPISPAGQWGPFTSRGGVYRLLKEVAHYLCRNNETTAFASLNNSSGFFLSDGRLATTARDHFAVYGSIPAVGQVAISDFSQGSQQTSALFVTGDIPSEQSNRYPAALFAADARGFLSQWTEVWDLDGAHTALQDREEFKKRLVEWYRSDGERQFRLYYSQYTGATLHDDDTGALSSLAKEADAPHVPDGKKQDLWAREIHARDRRWSNVMFSSPYLMGQPEPAPAEGSNELPVRPQFREDDPNNPWASSHQFVPNITFGHAVRLSKLT